MKRRLTRSSTAAVWVAWVLVALNPSSAATAQDLLIAGTQGSPETRYSFLCALTPIWGGQLGQGWYRKVLGSWLSYQFDKDRAGRSVTVYARAPGLEAGLGHAWEMGDTTADVSLSLGVRDTRLSPSDVPDTTRGTDVTLTPQGFVRHTLNTVWDAELLSSYSIGTEGRFARGRVGARIQPGWRVGLEVALVAGADYRNEQHGLFAGTDLSAFGMHIDVNAGRSRARDGKTSDYLGVSMSKTW